VRPAVFGVAPDVVPLRAGVRSLLLCADPRARALFPCS